VPTYTISKTTNELYNYFYLRQITGSVNYTNGTEIIDYLHGYLNYQIEHHLFPDMTVKSYRTMAPIVKEIYAKYGVIYTLEDLKWDDF